MRRETLVVGSTTAWHEERYQQAACNRNGVQILTLQQLVERLAGGFLRAATPEEIQIAATYALQVEKSKLHHLGPLVELPGTPGAVCRTLTTTWANGIDLSALTKEQRCADLWRLEKSMSSRLPSNALIPRDLVAVALKSIDLATTLLGALHVRGIYAVAPCWQPILTALAERIPIFWETIGNPDDWLSNTAIRAIRLEPRLPVRSVVSCANPIHEMTEALRWARELVTTGRAKPHEIAIAAATLETFDDHLRAMCDDSQLPIHFTQGRAALSDFAGQQAAALAELLLHGVSQDRVLRAIRLIRQEQAELASLPDGWDSLLKPDAPLLSVEHWRHELDRINSEQGVDLRPALMAFVECVAQDPSAAPGVGERWLNGRARGIWRRALASGPATALPTTLNLVRVNDDYDPAASILWGSAAAICTVRRRFIRLIGMSSRGWPRPLEEDPLLPEHILGRRLATYSFPELDRLYFDVLNAQASEVVFSRSRRDKEGRVLGISPLFPRDIETIELHHSRIPAHAFSQSDRLLARPTEFADSELARSATRCLENRRHKDITPHDGLVRAGHPVIKAALNGIQSATSLRMLLRDPLGFVWKYALRWKQPEDTLGEEPLLFDEFTKGTFIHELLEQAVLNLEQAHGFSVASKEQIIESIERACMATGQRWELEVPVPPRVIWERLQYEARDIAHTALTYPHENRAATCCFVEVPFGMADSDTETTGLPWNAAEPVKLSGTDILIRGRIDRLDLSQDGHFARVIDYKTVGKVPEEDPQLNGGKELQRAIYACVVRSLLPVRDVEAALLYPEAGLLFRADNIEGLVNDMVGYVTAAVELVQQGCALPGIGAEDVYNDMRFAFPSNAPAFYFPIKTEHRNAQMQALLPLWGM